MSFIKLLWDMHPSVIITCVGISRLIQYCCRLKVYHTFFNATNYFNICPKCLFGCSFQDPSLDWYMNPSSLVSTKCFWLIIFTCNKYCLRKIYLWCIKRLTSVSPNWRKHVVKNVGPVFEGTSVSRRTLWLRDSNTNLRNWDRAEKPNTALQMLFQGSRV